MSEFDEFKPENLVGSMGPIAFTARNAHFLTTFPRESNPWKLWAADLQAERVGGGTKVFEKILFAEDSLNISIYGIASEDGYPRELRADLALRQQAFIKFLRDERAADVLRLGNLAAIFPGGQYSVEYKATAAFRSLLASNLRIGVGYSDENGEYILLAIETGDQ